MWKAQSIKGKTEKLDLIKIEILCSAKDSVNKIERQDIDWDKIFENHVFNK